MIPGENPLDRAERIIRELSIFLPLILEPRAVLKGFLIGHIMERRVNVNKELLANGNNDIGEIFINSAKEIPLIEGLFQHSNLEKLALLMLDLDDHGTVIAGRGYLEDSIKQWYLEL